MYNTRKKEEKKGEPESDTDDVYISKKRKQT
jgi:hypothetical protein